MRSETTAVSGGIALHREGRNLQSSPCSAIIISVTLGNARGLSGLRVKNERVTFADLQGLPSSRSRGLSEGPAATESSKWFIDARERRQVSGT